MLPFLLYGNCLIHSETYFNGRQMANNFSMINDGCLLPLRVILTLAVVCFTFMGNIAGHFCFWSLWNCQIDWSCLFCLPRRSPFKTLTIKVYIGFPVKTSLSITPVCFTCTFNLGPFCRKPFYKSISWWYSWGIGKAGQSTGLGCGYELNSHLVGDLRIEFSSGRRLGLRVERLHWMLFLSALPS